MHSSNFSFLFLLLQNDAGTYFFYFLYPMTPAEIL